ncbi:hypothetical protein BDK51DRAFT_51270 [Blyttiomyces helicus]|uniref:Uncharacterized protein n=1 Tax=Blyttiomyces helicus TaxID=388810 RepID=A0A4P9WNR9_9FUNG|nr:hypothetical protein BDK51DRAFT_51270 [Blyttiomyces helicus]|eukprot:RKO94781.1 hypothetical protein BDK51DRAFT_51270 [Blyttiomyces helicus]
MRTRGWNFSGSVKTDGISLSITLKEDIPCELDAGHPFGTGRATSSPSKPTIPTEAEIRDKIGFRVHPGQRGIILDQVEPLTFPQQQSFCWAITASAAAPSDSTSAPLVPSNEDGYIHPLNEGDADGPPSDSKFDGTLRATNFSKDKFPMHNLSIAGYRQNARFVHAQMKLNALKRRFWIHLIESKLPEQAYTYEAAIARFKVIFRYTRELDAFYVMHSHRQQWIVKRFIPEDARAEDVFVAYGAANFSSSSVGSAPSKQNLDAGTKSITQLITVLEEES